MGDPDHPVHEETEATEPTTRRIDLATSNEGAQLENAPSIPSTSKLHDEAAQLPTNDHDEFLEASRISEKERRYSGDQVAPDELPPNAKGDVTNEASPTVGSVVQTYEEKAPAISGEPLALASNSDAKVDKFLEKTDSIVVPAPKKSFFESLIPAKIPFSPSKAAGKGKGTQYFGDALEQSGTKTIGDPEDGTLMKDEKQDTETYQKTLDKTDRKETEDKLDAQNKAAAEAALAAAAMKEKKAAEEKAWAAALMKEKKAANEKGLVAAMKAKKAADEKALAALRKKVEEVEEQWKKHCRLDVLPRLQSNNPTVDIVAIHDLDETPNSAWLFIPQTGMQKVRKSLMETDQESKRSSSVDRSRQLPQAPLATTEASKKRRSSMKGETTPGFDGNGKITDEERIKKAHEWQDTDPADSVDLQASIKEEDAALPTTSSSQAGPSNAVSQQDEPQTQKMSTTTVLAKEIKTKGVSSGKDKKENDGTRTKRSKSSKKKETTEVLPDPLLPADALPAVPQHPGTFPPELAQLVTGIDDHMQRRENEDGHASQNDPRSGRGSAEIEGSVRKRHIHLLKDGDMIPGSFPEARILSFTYPIMTSTISNEYLDKAAQKLLDTLAAVRTGECYNSVPIVFIGYGFGGLVFQKFLVLAAAAQVKENPGAAQILNMIAGLVVLDTPFPVLQQKDQSEKGLFPSEANARQEHILRRLKDSGSKVDVPALWEIFDNERQRQKLSMNWLYTAIAKDSSSLTKIQPKRPLPALAQIGIFCMAMVSDNKRRLGRFPGPQDAIYLRLVNQLQRCLLFKASAIKELEDLLSNLITLTDALVEVKDEQGRSALHYAAEAPNYAAVTVLVKQGEANVLQKDNLGQTPLHACIRRAVKANPTDKESQKPFKEVIKRLIEQNPDVNQADDDKNTAWDYAKDLEWIQELRKNRDPFSGPSTSNEAKTVEPPKAPDDKKTPKRKACQNILGVLAEFYIITEGRRTQENPNYERPNVFDMIYDEGPTKILDRSKPRRLAREVPRCRWMHLPANNEQWINDLFAQLKIKDNSISGQREGSKLSSLYLIPQASKYKHVREVHSKDEQLDNRNVSRTSDSPGAPPNPVTDPSKGTVDDKVTSSLQEKKYPPQGQGVKNPEVEKVPMVDKNAIALFMPILAYETSKSRKKMTSVIQKALQREDVEERSNESLLLQGYLGDGGPNPLHCRRTLDQFLYYMLDTTESRDTDQVIYRWGRKKLRKEGKIEDAPLLMVDQLWIWVLQDGTLITSFPNNWDEDCSYGLKETLHRDLHNQQRSPIGSIDHLVHWVIKHSVDFLRREGPSDIKFQEAFQSSINNIAEREGKQFKQFEEITTTLNRKTLGEKQKSDEIEKLFKLHVETRLLIEIKDIQDELNIVSSVLGQQKEMLEKLHKLCSTNRPPRVDPKMPEKTKPRIDLAADHIIDQQETQANQKGILQHSEIKEDSQLDKRREKKVHWFPEDELKEVEKNTPVLKNRSLIDDNLGIVKGNIRVVEDMATYAKQVHTSITNLLDLKQRQANAWEARFSREGSQQSQRQGNIMLVFTLVTIVFLPLSFMSSFFAISISSFPKDPQSGNTSWPLHRLSYYLFGISTLIFVPLIIIALSVNQITSSFRAYFFRKKNLTPATKTKDEYDNDGEHEKDNIDEDDDEDVHTRTDTSLSFDDESVDESLYAPIFGRWKFHTHVPILRKLWERKRYLNTDSDDEYLNDEDIVADYPLHYIISKISPWHWFRRKVVVDSDDDSLPPWGRSTRTPPPPVRRIIIRERRMGYRRRSDGSSDEVVIFGEEPWWRRRRGSSSDEASDVIQPSRVSKFLGPVWRLFRLGSEDEVENSSSATRTTSVPSSRPSSRGHKRVFARVPELLFRSRPSRHIATDSEPEFGSGSGSDVQIGVAERLGTAISEPFRRLFGRRRRRNSDIESLVDD